MTISDLILWHLAYTKLASNTIIQPGSLGQKVNGRILPQSQLDREATLERVRSVHFPEKPSRLAACFAFDNIDTASLYKQLIFPHGILHEVRTEANRYHVGNFNVLEPLPRRHESPEEIAIRYWRNDLNAYLIEYPNVRLSELVIAGPLIVVRAVG